ncbi:glycine zipper 2TM domain-containing protein [Guyparkeria hydrothermalis]|uniref:glycine zipper 2TM domain-containing protein n=1 Tax=Guyparkeria hydrothermalis TaxID=923 RepID=UPI0020220557|nr:glycine zipper 2TM domain-containing protein [Guyparkeria hydrothermalis]MCL7744986.1 glycine zipper 2TM domain-containing protein [Guyparkeria hydrothermalis]
MKHLITIVLAAAGLALLSGCASSLSSGAYSRDSARQMQTVYYGTVQSIRTVQIEGTKTPVGAGAGAVTGGILGSQVGGGTGRSLATVGGVVLGGLAGAAAEEGITRQTGYEITVRLDNGRTVSIVQAADVSFQPGERVRVIEARDGTTRVTR